ncbi:MAG: hypothetical protein ACRDHJ_03755 [Actinomycetota bacterium]
MAEDRLEHSCGGYFDAWGVCSECGGELNGVGRFLNRRAWGRRYLARDVPDWLLLPVAVVGFLLLLGAPALIAVALRAVFNVPGGVAAVLGIGGWIGFLVYLDRRA